MKIYIDENLPEQLAVALNELQKYHNVINKTEIEVLSISNTFGKGALDEEWLPQVSGSFVITKDCNIRKRHNQRDLFMENEIGMFFISVKGINYWDLTKLLINNWEGILKIIKKNNPPFAYKANSVKHGFKEW